MSRHGMTACAAPSKASTLPSLDAGASQAPSPRTSLAAQEQHGAIGEPERERQMRPGVRVQRGGRHRRLGRLAGRREAAQRALAGRRAARPHAVQAPQLEAGGAGGRVVAAQCREHLLLLRAAGQHGWTPLHMFGAQSPQLFYGGAPQHNTLGALDL
jgi:hypothetical protein